MTCQDGDGIAIGEKDLPEKFVLKILGHCETRGLWGLKHTREPVEKMVKFAKNQGLCLPIVRLIVTREGVFVLPLDLKKVKKPVIDDEDESEVKINVTIPKSEIKCVKVGESQKDASPGHCFRIKAHFRIVKHIDRRRGKLKKKIEEMFADGDGKVKGEVCKGCGRAQDKHDTPQRTRTDVDLLEKYKRIDWKRHGVMFYPIDNISYGVQDLVYTRVFSMIEVIGEKGHSQASPFVCHSFVCESHNTAKRLTYALDAAFQAYGKTLRDIRKECIDPE